MYYGIKRKEYDWMESYLTDRRQFCNKQLMIILVNV